MLERIFVVGEDPPRILVVGEDPPRILVVGEDPLLRSKCATARIYSMLFSQGRESMNTS